MHVTLHVPLWLNVVYGVFMFTIGYIAGRTRRD